MQRSASRVLPRTDLMQDWIAAESRADSFAFWATLVGAPIVNAPAKTSAKTTVRIAVVAMRCGPITRPTAARAPD
jgi:hypothetical protein